MPGFFVRAIGAALALLLAAYLLPGVTVHSAFGVMLAALVLGVVNALVRPLVVLLTLPLTIVTLGLFLLVVNAAMLQLVDALIDDIVIDGFFTSIIAAILVSIVSSLVSWTIGPKAKYDVLVVRREER